MIKIHTCECGFFWEHGRSGQHQCDPYYKKRIAALEKQNAELLAERDVLKEVMAIVRNYPDFDDETLPLPQIMDAALLGKRHQLLLDLDVIAKATAALQPSTQEVSNEG